MRYNSDGAADHQSKHLLTLDGRQATTYVQKHTSTVNYLLPLVEKDINPPQRHHDKIFHSNNSIWEETIYRMLHSDNYIKLESFFLFEWIPRSPGLYYTEDARNARRDAQQNIEAVENGVVIYNPYGKASMLDGGIGNYRLKPCKIEGADYFLMSASSEGICHEGFPVAVPSDLYSKWINEIVDRGTVVCTLIGHLKFIPDELDTLYHGYRDVPQLYLLVEDITTPAHPKSRGMEDLRVSVAVTFAGEVEGRSGLYATYVNFDPSDKHSLRLNLDWMENEYVGKKYNGTIITDFDQQQKNFPKAVFSLDKVMTRTLNYAEVASVSDKLYRSPTDLLQQQERVTLLMQKEVYMSGSSKYDMSNAKIGAVVDTVQGDFNQTDLLKDSATSTPLDLAALVPQLSHLWAEAQKEPDAHVNKESLNAIADAEASAKKGDENGALTHLKKAGAWAYSIAEKLTIAVAAKAIQKAMGIP